MLIKIQENKEMMERTGYNSFRNVLTLHPHLAKVLAIFGLKKFVAIGEHIEGIWTCEWTRGRGSHHKLIT